MEPLDFEQEFVCCSSVLLDSSAEKKNTCQAMHCFKCVAEHLATKKECVFKCTTESGERLIANPHHPNFSKVSFCRPPLSLLALYRVVYIKCDKCGTKHRGAKQFRTHHCVERDQKSCNDISGLEISQVRQLVEKLEAEAAAIDQQIHGELAATNAKLKGDMCIWPIRRVFDELLQRYNPGDYTMKEMLDNSDTNVEADSDDFDYFQE